MKSRHVNLVAALEDDLALLKQQLIRKDPKFDFLSEEFKDVFVKNIFYNEFSNFGQYRCMSFVIADYVFSVVYPLNVDLTLPVAKMAAWFKKKT